MHQGLVVVEQEVVLQRELRLLEPTRMADEVGARRVLRLQVRQSAGKRNGCYLMRIAVELEQCRVQPPGLCDGSYHHRGAMRKRVFRDPPRQRNRVWRWTSPSSRPPAAGSGGSAQSSTTPPRTPRRHRHPTSRGQDALGCLRRAVVEAERVLET